MANESNRSRRKQRRKVGNPAIKKAKRAIHMLCCQYSIFNHITHFLFYHFFIGATSTLSRSYSELIQAQIEKLKSEKMGMADDENEKFRRSLQDGREKDMIEMGKKRQKINSNSGLRPDVAALLVSSSDSESEGDKDSDSESSSSSSSSAKRKKKREKEKEKEKKEAKRRKRKEKKEKKEKKERKEKKEKKEKKGKKDKKEKKESESSGTSR